MLTESEALALELIAAAAKENRLFLAEARDAAGKRIVFLGEFDKRDHKTFLVELVPPTGGRPNVKETKQ